MFIFSFSFYRQLVEKDEQEVQIGCMKEIARKASKCH